MSRSILTDLLFLAIVVVALLLAQACMGSKPKPIREPVQKPAEMWCLYAHWKHKGVMRETIACSSDGIACTRVWYGIKSYGHLADVERVSWCERVMHL